MPTNTRDLAVEATAEYCFSQGYYSIAGLHGFIYDVEMRVKDMRAVQRAAEAQKAADEAARKACAEIKVGDEVILLPAGEAACGGQIKAGTIMKVERQSHTQANWWYLTGFPGLFTQGIDFVKVIR